MPEQPATGAAVVDLIRKAELASEESIHQALGGDAPAAAADAASRLVRGGVLTAFQARLILQGRFRGFRLGTYKILDQLGAGGMGQVYLAEHTAMKRRVALKVLPSKQGGDRANVERFYREARAVAALDHPNIVRAHDICQDQGVHFLVMEYAEGKDLAALLKERGGRLPYEEAVGYVLQAAAGLGHAHQKGLVHRDVKPANLLLCRDGVLKVLDMGLARFFEDDQDQLTQQLDSGAVMGTADYVAPEQLIDSSSADARADVYALGATLYHLVTGRPPFGGSTTAKLLAHQVKTALPLHATLPDVPEELSAVVQRMMAKSPDDRHASAAEVAHDLTPFGPGRSAADEFRGLGATPMPVSGRLPFLTASGTAAATENLSATAARSTRAGTEAGKSTDLISAQETRKIAAAPPAPPANRPVRRVRRGVAFAVLATATVAGGIAAVALSGGPAASVTPAPADVQRPAPRPSAIPRSQAQVQKLAPPAAAVAPDGRMVLVRKLDTPGAEAPPPAPPGKPSPPNPRVVEGLAYSPDGKHVLAANLTGEVRLWDPATGLPTRTFLGHKPTPLRLFAFLPDGRRFLSGSTDGTIRLWDPAAAEPHVQTFAGFSGSLTGLAVLPGGRRFVTGTGDGEIAVWDLEASAIERRFDPLPYAVNALAVSPDGTWLVAGVHDVPRPQPRGQPPVEAEPPPGAVLFDLRTGKEIRRAAVAASIPCVAIAPDGGRAAFAVGEGIAVWDLATGDLRTAAGPVGAVKGVAFTPDGRHVISGSGGGGLVAWDAATLKRLAVEVNANSIYTVSVSPDGRFVAVNGSSPGVWELPAGVAPGTTAPSSPLAVRADLAGATRQNEDAAFTPDGRLVAVACEDGAVRAWDAATGRLVTTTSTGPGRKAHGLAVLPDGKRALVTYLTGAGVSLIDLYAGKEVRRYDAIPDGATSVALLPDGKRFLTCGAGPVRLLEVETGREVRQYPVKSLPRGVAVTPDGTHFLLGGSDKTVRLIDLERGAEVRTVRSALAVWRMSVSPDGRTAAYPNADGFDLWDLSTGATRPLAGPTKQGDGPAFTPDGRFLVGGSNDRGLYVWDLATGKLLASRFGHGGTVRSVAVSPDGRTVATAGVDKLVLVWDLADPLKLAGK